MKCPDCKTWTEVKETRERQGGTYRRYVCANKHRFSTVEQVGGFRQAGHAVSKGAA